ncbi:hypothetical protein ESCO_006263 [Escovopsis weberi]|uniref:Uncharacterized protein n=1 Tax=Escovopsis weberi TaxID=150374 RepID=A0A0M8MZQ4_ESCWE|nr:hypothetical protein ESCO_006263 [Escovopsis weberi]
MITTRHYSYECKASTQERPYTSRPSRSQQLRNPKLVPKLTNDSLPPAESKKGVADEELAKIEAERARLRELEKREDEDLHRILEKGPALPVASSPAEKKKLSQPLLQEREVLSEPEPQPLPPAAATALTALLVPRQPITIPQGGEPREELQGQGPAASQGQKAVIAARGPAA